MDAADLDIFFTTSRAPDRATPLSMHSKSMDAAVCLQASFRDKDGTMIDRRREDGEDGASNYREARRSRDNIILLYPVDTSTA